jgi:hypothetical protein
MAGSRTATPPPPGWSKRADFVASCRTAASPDRLSACNAAAWRFPFFLSVCQDRRLDVLALAMLKIRFNFKSQWKEGRQENRLLNMTWLLIGTTIVLQNYKFV